MKKKISCLVLAICMLCISSMPAFALDSLTEWEDNNNYCYLYLDYTRHANDLYYGDIMVYFDSISYSNPDSVLETDLDINCSFGDNWSYTINSSNADTYRQAYNGRGGIETYMDYGTNIYDVYQPTGETVQAVASFYDYRPGSYFLCYLEVVSNGINYVYP